MDYDLPHQVEVNLPYLTAIKVTDTYRSPNENIKPQLDALQQLLNNTAEKVVTEDFNCRLP